MLIAPNEMNKVLNVTRNDVTDHGKKYFEQGKISVQKFDYFSDQEFFVKAFVEANLAYEVQIKKYNHMLKYKCDCTLPSKEYKICEHVMAVLFDLYINPERYQSLKNTEHIVDKADWKDFHFSKSNVSEYIRYYETLELNRYAKQECLAIKFIPELSLSGIGSSRMDVSFKVGKTKWYKIKDIYEFARGILEKETISYGKGLEFKHEIDAFHESSLPLVDFVLEYVSSYQAIHSFDENTKINPYYRNKMLLKHSLLDRFFSIYADKAVELEGYGPIKFVTQDPIFDLEVIRKDYLKVELLQESEEYCIFYGCHHVYVLYQNKLYRCSEGFQKNMLPLLEQFKKKNHQVINVLEQEAVSFSNFVLPHLRDYSHVKVEENLLEKYKLEELGVKVYLDMDEQSNLTAKLHFCYQDKEINPFDEQEEVILNRNMLQEVRVKELFMAHQFRLNEKEKYLFLDKEEAIYEFLTSGIEVFMQKFEVLVTERLKNKQMIQNKNLQVGVKMNHHLIEIAIENLDLSEAELKEIFKRYRLKKKYFRLKDGSFLNIENSSVDTLIKMSENFAISEKEIASGNVKVPKYRAMVLEKILNEDSFMNYREDEEFKQILKDMNLKEYASYQLPEGLKGELRSYQKIGFHLLKTLDRYHFGGILADDMGLGKTIQVIALLLDEKERNKPTTSIVVCPTSLILNWEKEINHFAPDLKVLVISGSQKERENLLKEMLMYDVLITSYDSLKRDIDQYKETHFRFVIADEAQYIKNNHTKNAMALKKLDASTRFALTGTPIENSLSELWSIFDFCMPGYLYSYPQFRENFEIPIMREDDEKTKDKLKNLISPFILRRTKKEVLKELPEKTETIMYNQMEEEQKKIYEAYLADTKLKISEELKEGKFEKNQVKILSLITRLRQICSHPSLFLEHFEGESAKLNQCMDLIEDAISSNHKLLLFSGFTSMFPIITKLLEKKQVKYYMLTGSTNVKERAKMVEEFNVSSDIKVFLISLKAGGTGLNLTGADIVIHYDPWWNLAVQNQATDRAYRIGQKKNVQVFKLVTKDTIEEKMIDLQEKKKGLLDSIVSNKENRIGKLTKDEILQLFGL